MRLINPGGLGQDATRRRAPASELTSSDITQDDLTRVTIQAFIKARLITANRVATSRKPRTLETSCPPLAHHSV